MNNNLLRKATSQGLEEENIHARNVKRSLSGGKSLNNHQMSVHMDRKYACGQCEYQTLGDKISM